MKPRNRVLVHLALLASALVVTFGFASPALAVPPNCSDVCNLTSPCSQICWGPGPGGFGAAITCGKHGCCDRATDDEADAESAGEAQSELAEQSAGEAQSELAEQTAEPVGLIDRLRASWAPAAESVAGG